MIIFVYKRIVAASQWLGQSSRLCLIVILVLILVPLSVRLATNLRPFISG